MAHEEITNNDVLIVLKRLKAALINIVILTMEQIIACNVKGLARSDKPARLCCHAELYNNLKRLSAHCFYFTALNFTVFIRFPRLL